MAQHSGFFNAIKVDGIADRRYNANDYSDNLAAVIGNGVLRSINDDLKVTTSGMTVTVGAGRAWINGHYYHNDSPVTFTAPTAPTGGSRHDRVVLRLNTDISARKIELVYVQGTASNTPTKPNPVREGGVYDLVLADVFVGTNATSVGVTDTRGNGTVCGWVYSVVGDGAFFASIENSFNEWFAEKKDTLSSVTLFKRYDWRTVLDAQAKTVSFNIPQYDEGTCILEVFVNGVLDVDGVDYTRSGSTITFTNNLVAGTEIFVRVYKSIDGTGILSAADEITELQNQVAALQAEKAVDYLCNGVDDNVKLSQIAQAWLDGGTDNAHKTIRVYGTFGASAAHSGNGSELNPYRWINVGSETEKERRITFDFSNCGVIEIPVVNGKFNDIFGGKNAHIIGAHVKALSSSQETNVRVFGSVDGDVFAEHCYFNIFAAKNCIISRTGTFTDCRGIMTSLDTDSYCFTPTQHGLLRIVGGEYMAYTGISSGKSAIVGQTAAKTITILDRVNAPTVAVSGYYQTHAIYQGAGAGVLNCRDLISALTVTTASGISTVSGTVEISRATS